MSFIKILLSTVHYSQQKSNLIELKKSKFSSTFSGGDFMDCFAGQHQDRIWRRTRVNTFCTIPLHWT